MALLRDIVALRRAQNQPLKVSFLTQQPMLSATAALFKFLKCTGACLACHSQHNYLIWIFSTGQAASYSGLSTSCCLTSALFIAIVSATIFSQQGRGQKTKRVEDEGVSQVILMSATLDSSLLTSFFDCQVLAAGGRTFPVEHLFLEDAYELTEYRLDDGSPAALTARQSGQSKALQKASASRKALVKVRNITAKAAIA